MSSFEDPTVGATTTEISRANFGLKVKNSLNWLKEQVDALATGVVVSARQGGSATDWAVSGATNYTPTGSILQCGTLQVTMNVGYPSKGTSFTFPIEFGDIPIVNATFSGGDYGYDGYILGIEASPTKSGCLITIRFSTNQTIAGPQRVFWTAIGPSA